jgi:hypothetical protein
MEMSITGGSQHYNVHLHAIPAFIVEKLPPVNQLHVWTNASS